MPPRSNRGGWLAMTPSQPTPIYLTLRAQLWELACLRWRPFNRQRCRMCCPLVTTMRSEPLLILLLILSAPSNHAGRNSTGIWGVNRQGCRFSRPAPWMARGGGPPNHWRITGTPSPSEVPSGGARALWLLSRFSKVTRCQSGTLGGRYRRNGYVHNPTVLTVRPPSRASPLPQWDRWGVR